jgi:hypothetical protein
MPKETNEENNKYMYVYIYICRFRNLQASHFLHDEHKIWCGKTNSSAHSKSAINTLPEFGGDKLAYRVPSSHEANQGKMKEIDLDIYSA